MSVTIEIMGGLGNQLFQVFTTLAYSLDTGRRFFLDERRPITAGHRKTTYWRTLLRPLAKVSQVPKQMSPPKNYSEPTFQYTPIPSLSAYAFIKLKGYFQSYLYFDKHRDTLLRLLKISETQQFIYARTQAKYPYATTLAMHFRVGDYAHQPQNHPLMPVQYYQRALTRHRSSEPTTVLYFYEASDESYVQKMVKQLQAEFPAFTFLPIDHNFKDWEQLIIMSLCEQGHIIANSTFSWWGAYLSTKSKPVYYPSVWFGHSMPHNTSDLFLPHWQRISLDTIPMV